MEAKEKAEELYNDYLSTVRFTMEDCSWSYRDDSYEFCTRKTAKWLCLKSVDEIMQFLTQASEYLAFPEQIKYWLQVKDEIESYTTDTNF